jgi:chromosome segregation ATPase
VEQGAVLNLPQEHHHSLTGSVAIDYNKAQTLTTKATTLSQQILDARLALTRLRQSHPHPRLTVPIATSTLEEQIVTMQSLDDEVQELNKQVSNVKEKLRTAKGEMEQIRTERAEVEKAGATSTGRVGDDDPRLMSLYDWSACSVFPCFVRVDSLIWRL